MTNSFYFKSDNKNNHYESIESVEYNIKNLSLPYDELLYRYKKNGYVAAIPSIYRAAEIANLPINIEKTGKHKRKSLSTRNYEWYQTKDMDHCNKLVREGWNEGLKKVHDISKLISSVTGSKIRIETCEYDIAGEEVDPVAFAAGESEHMVTYETEEKNQDGKIITIVLNSTVSGSLSAEKIINRGACILTLIDLLKSAGYEVRLLVLSAIKGGCCTEYIFYISVQEIGEYVDEDIISFVTAHPSFLRRILFSLCEHFEEYRIKQGGFYEPSGYGSVMSIKDITNADILFDEMDGREYKNIKDCSKKVIEMLKKCPNVNLKFEGED